MDKNTFVEKVTAFYEEEGRTFPWRRTDDPYRILVSEILLQQTNAEQVEEVYSEFFEKYPRPEALASAGREDIIDVIGVLGLHYRADRLKQIAEDLVEQHGGQIPAELEELLELHGVGNYVANAVLCFGFDQPRPLVDVNVARVLSEVFDLELKDRPRQDKELWAFAEELVPEKKFKEYNWGLLDIGARSSPRKKDSESIESLLN